MEIWWKWSAALCGFTCDWRKVYHGANIPTKYVPLVYMLSTKRANNEISRLRWLCEAVEERSMYTFWFRLYRGSSFARVPWL